MAVLELGSKLPSLVMVRHFLEAVGRIVSQGIWRFWLLGGHGCSVVIARTFCAGPDGNCEGLTATVYTWSLLVICKVAGTAAPGNVLTIVPPEVIL